MFQTGDQIGSYSLIQKLGKGAFGEVWLAEEKTAISAHKVALKLPNEEDVDIEAIRQEASVWEDVKGHPNILPIIKADIIGEQIYIASEYAPGGSLDEWLKNHEGKAPSVEIAVQMTRGILAGLEHLHSKGVIHRDLKPANILLQADTPRIADFGIARLIKAAAKSTQTAGTPSYMAPECFYSIRSEQSDIWAVGVLFHKLLTGRLPFSQPDQVSIMNAILNDEPRIGDEIPENLRQIIAKALQKNPVQRYKTAAEMRSDLNAFAADSTGGEALPQPPTPQPKFEKFEKEEETVIRPVVHQESFQPLEPRSSSRAKAVTIAFSALAALAAVAVWAGFRHEKNQPTVQTNISDFTNQSNGNSNLINPRGEIIYPANSVKTADRRKFPNNSTANGSMENSVSPNENAPDESKKNERTPADVYDIAPDAATPKPNAGERPAKSETPASDDAPSPKISKTPAPVETPPPPKKEKTTPKPTEKPDNAPAPLSENKSPDVNN